MGMEVRLALSIWKYRHSNKSYIAKNAFRIVLYITSFCMQHFAVARFVLKQWFVYDCTYFVAEMYNVVCYWKTAVFVLWINKSKCSLKTSVSLVLARLRVVPHLSLGIVARAKRELALKSPHARKGGTLRRERKMREGRRIPDRRLERTWPKPEISGTSGCWFSHDVTRIQTTKVSTLLRFYFHGV